VEYSLLCHLVSSYCFVKNDNSSEYFIEYEIELFDILISLLALASNQAVANLE